MIICITGLPGAGKSSVGKLLSTMGFRTYELGDVVRGLMKKEGIRLTPESDKEFTVYLKKKYGKAVVVRRLLEKVKLNKVGKVAIVGVKNKPELDYIKSKSRSPVVTIAVVAPVRLRFQRTRMRGRADAPRTLAEFIKNRDRKEARWGETDTIKNADYIISDTGTMADLKKNVRLVISQTG